jgi:hypothetical protein
MDRRTTVMEISTNSRQIRQLQMNPCLPSAIAVPDCSHGTMWVGLLTPQAWRYRPKALLSLLPKLLTECPKSILQGAEDLGFVHDHIVCGMHKGLQLPDTELIDVQVTTHHPLCQVPVLPPVEGLLGPPHFGKVKCMGLLNPLQFHQE